MTDVDIIAQMMTLKHAGSNGTKEKIGWWTSTSLCSN